jgi:hypothetical protein
MPADGRWDLPLPLLYFSLSYFIWLEMNHVMPWNLNGCDLNDSLNVIQ